ncbi:LacI family DNA-binding transcriptional regulator [Streptomyces sp. NBC_01477]|uniref:LacI family DNA-binding transcriptional regulator n=1 Tax=Streptomyces sp. NBC_01477 TaxID=2976015 RepID=UPI002E3123EF|nr:LacI family DNA-binding transcriptional regulator [Streptomyces sp. NBC_01477]
MSSGITRRRIAAEAGVSIATVSRVMTGNGRVAPGTREHVRAVADRLAGAASDRAAAPDGAVLVRCPYALTGYFGAVVSAVAETLSLHGRQVVLSAGDAARGSGLLHRLSCDRRTAGAVLVLPPESAAELVALRARGFPFVVVDPRTALPPDIASVAVAHLPAARGLTAHLLGLGHRRIGVIGGPAEWLTSRSRIAGHAAALAEAGLAHSPELLRSIEPTADRGYEAARELLGLPRRPTALAAFNDTAAVGALRAAHERGLRVPEDLSITGFDDTDSGRSTVPRLTTARQPLEEVGRLAVLLLVRLLDRRTAETPHRELAADVLLRDSTGPVA